MPILVTGFVSTAEVSNASGILIDSLMQDLPRALHPLRDEIELHVLEVNGETLKAQLEALLRTHNPTHCLFTGQAPGRNQLTLETVATNKRDIGPPLKPGEAPQSVVISDSGPDCYAATLPQQTDIVQALNEKGIPAALSADAGNNLCNQILYEGLRYAEQYAGMPQCGFLHIPALPAQVIARWPNYPFMPLDMMRDAIALILLKVKTE